MQSVSALIEFLMNLLRDEKAQAEFEQHPQATLAEHGLHNVSGQDVRDARLIMADDGAVHPRHGSGRSHHHARNEHDDPVREIRHTTQQYEASEHAGSYHYTVGDVSQTFTTVNVDDRDTRVVDSFNSDDDGIDNKGGKISESVLAGDDIDGQVEVDNADDVDVVAINKSFNEDNSSDTDVDIGKIEDSFNETTKTQPAPGSPAPDASEPDTPAPDANAPDTPGADVPADQSPADVPVDQPPVDEPPVDQPADESPVDIPPDDPSLVDQPPTGEPLVDEPVPDVPDDEPDLDHALV
jgi:hypothetical protein